MAYHFDHNRTREDNPAAHVDKPATIVLVYFAILIGVFATIGVSFAGLGDKAIFIHMAIAAVQVAILAYYWMHLQRSDSLTWLTALSGLFIMLILFALPLGDYLTRHLGGL
jgi:caa(3)-type oxidase subunit IV